MQIEPIFKVALHFLGMNHHFGVALFSKFLPNFSSFSFKASLKIIAKMANKNGVHKHPFSGQNKQQERERENYVKTSTHLFGHF